MVRRLALVRQLPLAAARCKRVFCEKESGTKDNRRVLTPTSPQTAARRYRLCRLSIVSRGWPLQDAERPRRDHTAWCGL